jgi:cation transport ATPase
LNQLLAKLSFPHILICFAFFHFAWLLDVFALLEPLPSVWLTRVALLPLFALLGYFLFRPANSWVRRKAFYFPALLSFAAGMLFYFLLITLVFHGRYYYLFSPDPPTYFGGQIFIPGPNTFSWHNYLLYPTLILLCLTWPLLLARLHQDRTAPSPFTTSDARSG